MRKPVCRTAYSHLLRFNCIQVTDIVEQKAIALRLHCTVYSFLQQPIWCATDRKTLNQLLSQDIYIHFS